MGYVSPAPVPRRHPLQNFRRTPSEPLEFWCMLAPWIPTFPVRSDPPLLEVFAVGAAVLVGITLVHGSILGRIVRGYHRGAKRLLEHANHPFWASLRFGHTVLLMLVLHIVDMSIWAGCRRTDQPLLHRQQLHHLRLRNHAARLRMARTQPYDGD